MSHYISSLYIWHNGNPILGEAGMRNTNYCEINVGSKGTGKSEHTRKTFGITLRENQDLYRQFQELITSEQNHRTIMENVFVRSEYLLRRNLINAVITDIPEHIICQYDFIKAMNSIDKTKTTIKDDTSLEKI